ncbi:OmpA family protein [Maribacter arcticus]|nr:OmpA family protein [Maribacter arcticus]
MTKTTTNLLLMLITIVAGTFFYITCCSECGATAPTEPTTEQVIVKEPEATAYHFPKDYLKNNGIASDKIVATSKGQTEPIANDTTEEGKDKNSRTVITLN